MARDWVFLFGTAFCIAAAWAWLITWAIRTFGDYKEEEEE